MRLLLNCLHPDIAKKPQDLVAYGGSGKVARDQRCLSAIVDSLEDLGNDETLLVQSGKPVGIFATFPSAPRVIMAGAMLVPRWSCWETFYELERRGLTCYGQSTAGSWSYIGTQGILQGTWETFYQAGLKHFGGSLRGRLILSSGLGQMGSAQPLAVTANGGVAIIVEVDEAVVQRRLLTSVIDVAAESVDEAIDIATEHLERGEPISIGVTGNASDVYEDMAARRIVPDIVTDQTPAHDLMSYVPSGCTVEEASELREKDPAGYERMVLKSIGRHVTAMLALRSKGSVVFDYGNNLREQGRRAGVSGAFSIASFVSEYMRPLFCRGRGPFRWVALSGDPGDIYRTDEVVNALFRNDRRTIEWIQFVERRLSFHGLPARVCWLDSSERLLFGQVINRMVRLGELRAPVAITRDHMEGAAVASPFRETEGMMDGSDAIADWPVLNAMLNCACGATLLGLYQGGGVGIGYSIHSGMTVVADGSEEAEMRLRLALQADSALGVLRYADAGYESARAQAAQQGFARISDALGLNISVGIGRRYGDVQHLHLSYREALRALSCRYFLGIGQVIHIDQILLPEEHVGLVPPRVESDLALKVLSCDRDGAFSIIDDFLASVRRTGFLNPVQFKSRMLELFAHTVKTVLEAGADDRAIASVYGRCTEAILLSNTLQETIQQSKEFLNAVIDCVRRGRERMNLQVFEKAVQYIRENFRKPLRLHQVARHVYVSDCHFSHGFKRFMGMSFENYLTGLRMNEAKKLLLTTEMRVKEVAAAVGYRDPNYFGRAFRAEVGVPPSRFKPPRSHGFERDYCEG